MSVAVVLLRCELRRLAPMLARDGIGVADIDAASPAVDAQLLEAAIGFVGYAVASWEAQTLRRLDKYPGFNGLFATAERFVGDQSMAALTANASSLAVFVAAVAQLRGLADPCAFVVTLPGVSPPDPELLGKSFDPETLPPPPPLPPIRRRQKRKVFGGLVLGTASAATAGLLAAALVETFRGKRLDLPSL